MRRKRTIIKVQKDIIINDLVNFNGLKIVQNKNYFNFSLDSILLPNFIEVTVKMKNIIDLGTGNAPIPLILSTKTNSNIIGVEIQKEIYDLAVETIKINKLENQITLINEDIKNIPQLYGTDKFDLVLSNPPYFKVTSTSILNENDIKSNARHENLINLEEIIKTAKVILKNNAPLVMIHDSTRSVEIIDIMKRNNIEPKRIRFIHPKHGLNSNLVLVEGRKNGKTGVKILPPLYVHEIDGSYTEEVKAMFTVS